MSTKEDIREWHRRHPTYARDKMRKNYVVTTVRGKRTLVKTSCKRSRPKECELCGKIPKKLSYHHWDPENPVAGLYLCHICHMFAERCDVGLDFIMSYFDLRARAEREVEEARSLLVERR